MTPDAPLIGAVGRYIVPLALPVLLPVVLLLAARRLWYEYFARSRDPACDAPLPDGSMGWPLIGETISFALRGSEFYDKKFQQHGRLFKTHLFGRPTVRVQGADNIRTILHGENDIVTSYWPAATRVIFGSDCLTQSQGPYHARLRKHVSAAFSHSALSGYVSLVQPLITETIAGWCRAADGVDTYPECRTLTFRVSGKVLCGFDCSTEETASLIDHFEEIVYCLFCLPINIPGGSFNKGLKARDFIAERIKENILRKMENNDTQDALGILMEQDTETGEMPSIKEIVANAMDLLVAGYASMASAACSIVRELYNNRHVLARVRRELAEHRMTRPGSPVSLEDINRLKYVSCVVKEILRMSPPIGAAFRKALRTFELDGKQIPAGWTVLYSIRETVGASDTFRDKDKFDPDRFGEERSEDRAGDRYNYCIFGGGPRSCIGQSFAVMLMRLLVVELARSCDWRLLRPDALRMTPMPTPHPVDGMPAKFTAFADGGLDHNSNSFVFAECESETASDDAPSSGP